MRSIYSVPIVLALTAGVALAQTPPANNGPNNNAVNSGNGNNPGAPVKGANSFTMGQAKSRIEARGYRQVKGLKKDANGVWRGTAVKDGKSSAVSVDFQGNVVGE